MMSATNVDATELNRFNAVASHWWDVNGPLRTLHGLNPLRVQYIRDRATLAGQQVLDVGCGGGILAEALSACGAHVTAIDLAHEALLVARLHAAEGGLAIDYREIAAETLVETAADTFDVVTCFELLEHVPDPASVVRACARLVKPGGLLFLSTINRTPKAWLMAILGAEYALNILPRGTHEYARFIRPSELAGWLRAAGLSLCAITGVRYLPFLEYYRLGSDVDVNYLAYARRPL